MPFAVEAGFVAGFLQQTRKGNEFVALRAALGAVQNVMARGELPREDAGKAGGTQRCAAEGVLKRNAFARQCVDVGSFGRAQASAAQRVEAQIVDDNNHEVGSGRKAGDGQRLQSSGRGLVGRGNPPLAGLGHGSCRKQQTAEMSPRQFHALPYYSRCGSLYLETMYFPEALNAIWMELAGRSGPLDLLVVSVATNTLLKAGVIGACLMAAWSMEADLEIVRRRLVLVLLAAVVTLGITRKLGEDLSWPRPYVLSGEAVMRYQDAKQSSYPKTVWRPPMTQEGANQAEALQRGLVSQNDMESFPSDHAGFFGCLAFGLLWASRSAGWVALGWTLVVILPGKLLRGLHRPADIFAGLAIALLVLLVARQAERWRGMKIVGRLLQQWSGVATGLFFLAAMEATCTLAHIPELIALARRVWN
jgi:membrane-associated phospholipid phosphatase